MKLKFKNVAEGVQYDGKNFNINFLSDAKNDIINLCDVTIHETIFDNLTYIFGYEFKEDVSSNIRTKFLHFIKGLDENQKPSIRTIEHFVEPPLAELNRIVNLSTFSCILYPRSNRSELTRQIQSCIVNMLPDINIESFELIKNLPEKIKFSWTKFNMDYDGDIGDQRYLQIKNYVKKTLMPKIHPLDYFSIAQNVKYKYRKYITNYLTFNSPEDEEVFKSLNGGNILIIDDINTSGSTLREILKHVRVLAPDSKIFIFTLIGGGRDDI